jgi:hypothetical protein
MDNLEQVPASGAAGHGETQARLMAFAERIAQGWADELGVGKDAVEWVAIQGGCRTPVLNARAEDVIHLLEKDTGIAFILGSPGMMDLLFVVTVRGAAYSVNVSNNAKPWDRSERRAVRPDRVGDVKHLLAVVRRYVKRLPI